MCTTFSQLGEIQEVSQLTVLIFEILKNKKQLNKTMLLNFAVIDLIMHAHNLYRQT